MTDDCYDCWIRDTCILYHTVELYIEKHGMNSDMGEGLDFLTGHRCDLYVKPESKEEKPR